MIGLAANVLVRSMMQDDARQSASASALMKALIQDRPGFACLTRIVGLVWVLSAAHGRDLVWCVINTFNYFRVFRRHAALFVVAIALL